MLELKRGFPTTAGGALNKLGPILLLLCQNIFDRSAAHVEALGSTSCRILCCRRRAGFFFSLEIGLQINDKLSLSRRESFALLRHIRDFQLLLGTRWRTLQ